MKNINGTSEAFGKREGDFFWEEGIEEKFKSLIKKIPIFLRSVAEKKVEDKARNIVREEKRFLINEKDLVDAFFAETPFGFHGLLKADMEGLNVDYMKYGYGQ